MSQNPATTPFPEIEPFDTGHLPEDAGHSVYFEQSGLAQGEPVLFLHGGPGSGCIAAHRRFFDPTRWRAVLFDQRGCGRSRPVGGVESNTTAHLVADIERLREHLSIDRWVVFGGSWGSTLALAYARAHPQRVRALILRGIFLARRDEIDWFVYGLQRFLPEVWAGFEALAPAARHRDLLAWYHEAVFGADRQLAVRAAQSWSSVETAAMGLTRPAPAKQSADPPDDADILAKARIQLHYIANACFLGEAELLTGLDALSDIPVEIVQGRLDTICPPQSAADLARALPHARLHVVDLAGHSAFEPGIAAELMAALERIPAVA